MSWAVVPDACFDAPKRRAFEWSSGTKVDLSRCFLLTRLVMGGNGAGKPSESEKKHKGRDPGWSRIEMVSKYFVTSGNNFVTQVTLLLPR